MRNKVEVCEPHSAIPNHSAGSSVNLNCFWRYSLILTGFYNDVSMTTYILKNVLKNNAAQLYFI